MTVVTKLASYSKNQRQLHGKCEIIFLEYKI